MVGFTELWLPILLSAVFVFVLSWIIHVLLPFHKGDYAQLPNEESVLEAMRKAAVAPGDYFFPYACGKEMRSEETKKKFALGPVGMMTVRPNGMPAMGKALAQWFVYLLVICVFVAYVTGRTTAPGTDYLHVFRVAGAVAFLAFAGSHAHNSIWAGMKWSTTLKFIVDGFIYALFVAGTFGWLWPR